MPNSTIGHYYNSPYKQSPPDLFVCFFLCKIRTSKPQNSGLHIPLAPRYSKEAH